MLELRKGVDILTEVGGIKSIGEARKLFEKALDAENLAKLNKIKTEDALIKIAEEARTDPALLHEAPHKTKFGRMDEVKAARELVLCCWLPEDYENQ